MKTRITLFFLLGVILTIQSCEKETPKIEIVSATEFVEITDNLELGRVLFYSPYFAAK